MPRRRLQSARVLVIERSLPSARLFAAALTMEGALVHVVPGVKEGLEAIPRMRPKVVIMDLEPPEQQTLDTVRALKAAPTTGALVIVGVTARNDASLRLEACEAGCAACLFKPIEVLAFAQTVAELLVA